MNQPQPYRPGDYVYFRDHNLGLFSDTLGYIARQNATGYQIVYWDGQEWRTGAKVAFGVAGSRIVGYAPFAGQSSYEGFYKANNLLNDDGSTNDQLAAAFVHTHTFRDGSWQRD